MLLQDAVHDYKEIETQKYCYFLFNIAGSNFFPVRCFSKTYAFL